MADHDRTTPGRIEHSHHVGESMQPDALRRHLMTHHGWTEAMMNKGRADPTPAGDAYVQSWHRGAHIPMARPDNTRPGP
ncbi:hypothetical protein [Streptomyces sp. PanSC9]|uniref:hypothetical protein n=1 Tax=Streptomyces sp. PanSC9 TaxID=1520461 RepID=UPI000F46472F|nr:hypothetical protein [Streptomyces sp. PanSC9]